MTSVMTEDDDEVDASLLTFVGTEIPKWKYCEIYLYKYNSLTQTSITT